MPTPPYLKLLVRKNSGAFASGAITCAHEDVIRLRLENTSGIESCRYEMSGYPPGWPTPSGWSLNAGSRTIYFDGLEPPDFALPTEASELWGKWLLKVTSNRTLVDNTSALEIVSSSGLHAMAAKEGAQFGGAALTWVKHLDANMRILNNLIVGGGGAPSGPAGGDLDDTYPNPRVVGLLGHAIDTLSDPVYAGQFLAGFGPEESLVWQVTPAPTTTGQTLSWDNTEGKWELVVPGTTVELTGDVTGESNENVVNGIVDVPINTVIQAIEPGTVLVPTNISETPTPNVVWLPTTPPTESLSLLSWSDGGGPTGNGGAAWMDWQGLAALIREGTANGLDCAGSGALDVLSAQWAYSLVALFGVLTGDRTLTLSSAPGRRCLFVNGTSGTYLLRINGPSGGGTYLLPGQSRLLWVDNSGTLRGEDLRALVCERSLTINGIVAGNSIDFCALPALTTVDLFEALETTTIAPSGLFLNAGTNTTPIDSVYRNVFADSPAGTVLHGKDKTKLGTLMVDDGYGLLTSASTLKVKVGGVGTATAGVVRALFRGRWLG